MKKRENEYRRQQLNYAYAFVMALALTFAAYFFVVSRAMSASLVAFTILVCAGLQLYIQSRYFLHLDDTRETPRWRLASYLFTWLTLLIIVIGSLWIMMNLNYNMKMSPEDMSKYMQAQNRKGF